ncbi:hypothetical protein [Pedobacter sp. MC2016-24]|uniref:hypothetical protein n=1 Tax=Pedobacter sp. MC2016-24 TaxID=2780090 RepID=UPI0018802DA7|nr:hypothetical protein [Pedobacter sp. MC2016-24]MBE9600014.1 hypothetical protein [Pedobacter sp. MC2016-24]
MKPKYKVMIVLCCFAVAYAALLSCTKKQANEMIIDQNPAPETPGTGVMYAGAVQNLLSNRCGTCHSTGRSAAVFWNFSGYTAVTTNADRIKQAVLINKTMPMGGSLNASELKLLQDWFNDGMKP